jgi:hypothetical protein
MSVLYCGLEKSNGKLGFTAKAILCSWCIVSLLITSGLFGIETMIEHKETPPPQLSLLTVGASILTLCVSSSCVYCAT